RYQEYEHVHIIESICTFMSQRNLGRTASSQQKPDREPRHPAELNPRRRKSQQLPKFVTWRGLECQRTRFKCFVRNVNIHVVETRPFQSFVEELGRKSRLVRVKILPRLLDFLSVPVDDIERSNRA